jgi:hypothetical protein
MKSLDQLPADVVWRTTRQVEILTDEELIRTIHELAYVEGLATACLVAHLAEMEKRHLHLQYSSSLFNYCTSVLKLSEDAAYARIKAARVVRKYPYALELLEDGALNLTVLRLIAPYLTSDNHREVLTEASHRSKLQIEELIARRWPRPDVPTTIRKLPGPSAVPTSTSMSLPLLAEGHSGDATTSFIDTSHTIEQKLTPPDTPIEPTVTEKTLAGESRHDVQTAGSAKPHRPGTITPLSPTRYKIQFTAPADTCDKIRQARDLLRHKFPDGDLSSIVDLAMETLLVRLRRRKLAALVHEAK